MPVTPQYSLRQDQTTFSVVFFIRFLKSASPEVYVESTLLVFHLKPYFLRLQLGHRVVVGSERVKVDYEKNRVVLTVLKETPGEEFQGLSLLGKGRGKGKGNFGSKVFVDKPALILAESVPRPSCGSGFNFQREGSLVDYEQEKFELWKLDADVIPLEKRADMSKLLLLSQYVEPDDDLEVLGELLAAPGFMEVQAQQKVVQQLRGLTLTASQAKTIREVPAEELLISAAQKQQMLVGLVDILFAFCYEFRCMGGELGCQSARTVTLMSTLLSCNFVPDTIEETLTVNYQRALCYPLYRYEGLCRAAQEDTAKVLAGGQATSALLELRAACELQSPFYIQNRLHLDSFISFAEAIPQEIKQLGDKVRQVTVVLQAEKTGATGGQDVVPIGE